MFQYFRTVCMVSLFVFLVSFNSIADLNLKIHKSDASHFPEIKIYLSLEMDGTPIDNIENDAFQAALEDGKDVSIKNIKKLGNIGENIAMVLAVDTSGSIKKKQLKAIKQAIKNLILKKAPEDIIAIISFNDDVYINCDFTKDSELLISKLNELKSGGKITVLFKALYQGIEMLDNSSFPSLKYLVVLSDGKDEGVGFKLDDPINKARNLNIPVYSLGFVSKADPKFLDNMVSVAKKTDGEYRRIEKNSDFFSAYSSIAGNTLSQQVLTLNANFNGDSRDHNLELKYTASNGEVRTANITFNAPMFKQVIINHNEKPVENDSEDDSETKDDNIIKNLPDNILYSICSGIILLLLLIVIFFLKKKRKNIINNIDEDDTGIIHDHEYQEKMGFEDIEDDEKYSSDSSYEVNSVIEYPLILKISGSGKEFPLSPGTITIGAYPENTIVLDQNTVSGYHAEITGNGSIWQLKDLGSTNGTKVNNNVISKPIQIKEGDIIRIGPFDIEVCM